jgi:hypothetical protein
MSNFYVFRYQADRKTNDVYTWYILTGVFASTDNVTNSIKSEMFLSLNKIYATRKFLTLGTKFVLIASVHGRFIPDSTHDSTDVLSGWIVASLEIDWCVLYFANPIFIRLYLRNNEL